MSADDELTITRTFNAPRELVWRAWTDPAQIMQWWGPQGFSNERCEAALQTGGHFHLEMRAPDGNVYPCLGNYREIVAPERLVFESTAEDTHPCGAGLPPHALVTITLAENNGKTTLTLHTRFASAERKQAAADARYVTSWEEALVRLSKYLPHAHQSA